MTNPTLKDYCVAINAWVESGFKDNPHNLRIDMGLCVNAIRYANSISQGSNCEFDAALVSIENELKERLIQTTGDARYPFNGFGRIPYGLDDNKYTNEARLDWIRKHM